MRLDQTAGYRYHFMPRLPALMEFDVAQRDVENTREKFQQGIIGASFDGRCGQTYFEGIAVQPGYFAALRSRLNMQRERDDIIPAAVPLGHLRDPHLQQAHLQQATRDMFQHAYRHNQDQLADDKQ